mgnify:FL=1
MQTITSPYPTEKGNVLYLRYGRGSGSTANRTIQKMIASASLSTPSVAASGATTVWANGPIAPPQFHFRSNTKQKQSQHWKQKMTTYTCAAYMRDTDDGRELRSYIKMQDNLHSPKYFREAEDHSRMQPLDRPVLWRAVEHCRKTGAIFVAVSLTNFGKTKAEGLRFLKHANVPFRIERSPSCNINNIDMAIDFAEDNINAVASRTKAALDKIQKQFGDGAAHISHAGNMITKLGAPDPSIANARKSEIALKRTLMYFDMLYTYRKQGMSFQRIADELNSHGVPSPTSTKNNPKLWYASGVSNYYKRGLDAHKNKAKRNEAV